MEYSFAEIITSRLVGGMWVRVTKKCEAALKYERIGSMWLVE